MQPPAATTLVAVGVMLIGVAALNALCGWWVFRRAVRDLDPRAALAAG